MPDGFLSRGLAVDVFERQRNFDEFLAVGSDDKSTEQVLYVNLEACLLEFGSYAFLDFIYALLERDVEKTVNVRR